MEKEREDILTKIFDTLIPLAPDADQRERERNELMRMLTAKNSGWLDCPIEQLRYRIAA
jgi:hypothetical protein